jgi:hypothetical protein
VSAVGALNFTEWWIEIVMIDRAVDLCGRSVTAISMGSVLLPANQSCKPNAPDLDRALCAVLNREKATGTGLLMCHICDVGIYNSYE